MKILAFHLPQYYVFKENNEWWGEGFTDWVNVKKSEPRFKGHMQPRVPLDENYYDMTDVKTLQRQADLAKEYGVYGICYYHYWFDGKMLLEKPCEILLEHPEIDENYCMCWANEPWTRSWDGKSREVIMPQRYGDEKEWEEHFQYMLKFFKDERYIKIDNKPVYILYRTNNIERCNDMIQYWEKRSKDYNFNGIYIIEEVNSFQTESVCADSSAVLEFEPLYTNNIQDSLTLKLHRKVVNFLGRVRKLSYRSYSYDLTWKAILNRRINRDKKTCPGAFVGWDNSARRKNGATMILGTPQKFEKYFTKQIKKAEEANAEFVFINAWNEWAEGAYLEPDEHNGYAYLEAVKRANSNC